MRPKRRLYKLWKFFKKTENVFHYFKKIYSLENEEAMALTKVFLEKYSDLKDFHFERQDLRFNQVIQINIAYFPGFSFYLEDDNVLIKLGCKPEEVIMWGINYTKDMKRLKNTKWKYLCELDLDHVKAIVEGGYTKDPVILEFFNKKIQNNV